MVIKSAGTRETVVSGENSKAQKILAQPVSWLKYEMLVSRFVIIAYVDPSSIVLHIKDQ